MPSGDVANALRKRFSASRAASSARRRSLTSRALTITASMPSSAELGDRSPPARATIRLDGAGGTRSDAASIPASLRAEPFDERVDVVGMDVVERRRPDQLVGAEAEQPFAVRRDVVHDRRRSRRRSRCRTGAGAARGTTCRCGRAPAAISTCAETSVIVASTYGSSGRRRRARSRTAPTPRRRRRRSSGSAWAGCPRSGRVMRTTLSDTACSTSSGITNVSVFLPIRLVAARRRGSRERRVAREHHAVEADGRDRRRRTPEVGVEAALRGLGIRLRGHSSYRSEGPAPDQSLSPRAAPAFRLGPDPDRFADHGGELFAARRLGEVEALPGVASELAEHRAAGPSRPFRDHEHSEREEMLSVLAMIASSRRSVPSPSTKVLSILSVSIGRCFRYASDE